MVIQGDLITLRSASTDDIDDILRWVNNPAASPYWYGKERSITGEEFSKDWKPYYFDGSSPEKGRCFIIEAESGPIGMVSYSDNSDDIDGKPVTAAIDIIIGDADNQNRGFGTDAIKALSRHLFEELGFHRIETATYEFNFRMMRCLRKAGFQFEGIGREANWVDGRFIDDVRFSMLENDLL